MGSCFQIRTPPKIIITDSCWLWTASLDTQGYPQIWTDTRRRIKMRGTRAMWIIAFGPIPEGQNVLHDCPNGDNPICVCPAHLWLGTHADNVRDKCNKHRQRWRTRYGESHGRARLTWIEVMQIRDSALSQRQLARHYGVGLSTIHHILKNHTWLRPSGTGVFTR
jgi:hypothetical protein